MNIVNLPIITTESESEIKEIFEKTFLAETLSFEDIALKFFPEDFQHICFEDDSEDLYKAKFSIRKARKMLAIKELCDKKIPYVLINQINRNPSTVCVLAESIEFALFLVPKISDSGKYLRIGTIICYGKNVESKIQKQKKNGIIVKRIEEVF